MNKGMYNVVSFATCHMCNPIYFELILHVNLCFGVTSTHKAKERKIPKTESQGDGQQSWPCPLLGRQSLPVGE